MKASIINLLKAYVSLTKPERTAANVMTGAAGFLFAAQWHFNWSIFLAFITGLTSVVASSCVLNNYIDRDLDQKMERTQKRLLASGMISAAWASVFAAVLGIVGFWLLIYTNWLTVAIVAIGFFSYVVVYSLAKRYTVYSTLIGTVPGAASLVAGYSAVTDRLDRGALILFLLMLSWQMVHFYAIAIYRLKDYAAAKIPVLPVKKGLRITKINMLFYLIIFIFAANLLTWEGYTGYIFLVGMALLGLLWLRITLRGFATNDNNRWAREVFKFSLIVLLAMCVLLAVGPILP